MPCKVRQTAEARILGMVAASDGAIVVLLEAYIDESGTSDDALAHVIAGYVIKPDLAERMAEKWNAVVSNYGLPFFHMTDCAAYEVCEPYKSLGREKCIALATELIRLIRRYWLEGFAVCFSPKYYMTIPDEDIHGENFYDFSVGFAHITIQGILKRHAPDAEVTYFLEAGHRHQSYARAVLDRLRDNDKWRHFNYAFFDKQSATLLQAADILAWHCATHIRRKVAGHSIRKDFKAITEKVPHVIYHLSTPDKSRPTLTAISPERQPQFDDESIRKRILAIYKLDTPVSEIEE